jgi:hypothetical protein
MLKKVGLLSMKLQVEEIAKQLNLLQTALLGMSLCEAFYEDLLNPTIMGKQYSPMDLCPDEECKIKISKHAKKSGDMPTTFRFTLISLSSFFPFMGDF